MCCSVQFSINIVLLFCLYRLGHREQKDEWVPRLVDVFQRKNVLPPDAVVSAGSANSACTAGTEKNSIKLIHLLFSSFSMCMHNMLPCAKSISPNLGVVYFGFLGGSGSDSV